MSKQYLIDSIAAATGLTKVDTAKVLDALSDVITDALRRGEKVTWTGFGTFKVRTRAARVGRNPQTGQPLNIPAGKTPAFTAGKGLKDAVK